MVDLQIWSFVLLLYGYVQNILFLFFVILWRIVAKKYPTNIEERWLYYTPFSVVTLFFCMPLIGVIFGAVETTLAGFLEG